MKRLPLVLVLVFALCLLTMVPAYAQIAAGAQGQAKITIDAQAGFGDDGTYVIGEWFPVRVTVTNPASGAIGRVRVEAQSKGSSDDIIAGSYVREIDLPQSARKEVTLYAYSGNFARTIEVRLLRGDTVIATKSARIEPLEGQTDVVLGVVSSDASLLNVLGGESIGHLARPLNPGGGYYPTPAPPPGSPSSSSSRGPTRATVVHMGLAEIPELSVALNSLGVLFMDDVDTATLSEAQRAAVTAWVARGGSLVLVARPGGLDATAGFVALLPATPGGTLSLSSFESLSNLVAVPVTNMTPAPITEATVLENGRLPSRVVASENGTPLIVTRDIGKGRVVYMALSPGLPPLKGWDGTVPLMQRILAEHEVGPSPGSTRRNTNQYYPFSGAVFQTYNSLFSLPGLNLPEPAFIGLFLLIYIMAVGPINFIILRRMKRTELAWLTIPGIVLFFSAVAWLMAYGSKGGDLLSIQSNVVQTVPGIERASATQFYGFFSPARGTYAMQVDADSAITQIDNSGYSNSNPGNSPAQVVGGVPTRVDNVVMNAWSLRGFMAENTLDATSPLEADLRLGDNIIEGTVRNRSNEALQDVALVRGDAVQYIGFMPPGGSSPVKLRVSASRFNNNSPASLLPPPSGVTAPTSSGGSYYGSQGNVSDEQRAYNRKVELLGNGLLPYISDDPPADMDVTVLAWGPDAPSKFRVSGSTVPSDSLNLWISRVKARSRDDGTARLKAGSVPLSIYAPGETGGNARFIKDMPARGNALALVVDPYADILYRLPAGTKPQELQLSIGLGRYSGAGGEVILLAYNSGAGGWDRIGNINNTLPNEQSDTRLTIPNPALYVNAAGDVTLRLQSASGRQTINLRVLDLSLNSPGPN